MASLLDFLLGQGTPLATDAQGQVTGPAAAPTGGLLGGLSNFLGNNSDRLTSMGMGFLSGANQAEGFQNAMLGMQRGATLDRQRALLQQAQADKLAKQRAAMNAAKALNIDPNVAEAAPDIIGTVAGRKYDPDAGVNSALKRQQLANAQYQLEVAKRGPLYEDMLRLKAAGATPEQIQQWFQKQAGLGPQAPVALDPEKTYGTWGADGTFKPAQGVPQGGKTTDDIREYQYDMGQRKALGQDPVPFNDWMLEKKKAGATKVDINSGEKGYDATVGKGYGDRFLEYQKGAEGARTKIGTLSTMGDLMDTPGFRSGAGAETAMTIRKGIAALGGDPKAAPSMEAFRSLASKATLDGLGTLGAGVSNGDRDFIERINPTLANTPEGNRLQIAVLKRMEERKIQIAQQSRAYAKANGGRLDAGFDDYIQQWADKNPLFSPEEQQKLAAGTLGQSQALTPGQSKKIGNVTITREN